MLSRRAAFSLIAGLALVLSLGVKSRALNLATAPDIPRFNRELVQGLQAQGFTASIEDKVLDLDFVVASRGDCYLRLRSESSADLGDSFRKFAHDLPVQGFRYGGTLRGDYPRGSADLDALFNRMALRLGLATSSEFPLAYAASPACELGAIDFGPQRTFPKPVPPR
jgi:hypothetical protein